MMIGWSVEVDLPDACLDIEFAKWLIQQEISHCGESLVLSLGVAWDEQSHADFRAFWPYDRRYLRRSHLTATELNVERFASGAKFDDSPERQHWCGSIQCLNLGKGALHPVRADDELTP